MYRIDRPSGSSDKGTTSAGRISSWVDVSPLITSADRRFVRWRLYRPDSRPLVKLQSLLAAVAVVTAVLLVLVGATDLWHDGGGNGSVAVDIIRWIVWILYTLAKVILVAVLLATIYQWFVSRRKPSTQS